VHKEAQLAGIKPVLLLGDTFALGANVAQEREVARAKVSQGTDRSVLRQDEQVERRHGLLVPFPVRGMAVRLGEKEAKRSRRTDPASDKASLGVVIPMEDIFGFRRAIEDVVDPADCRRRDAVDVWLDHSFVDLWRFADEPRDLHAVLFDVLFRGRARGSTSAAVEIGGV
jgi:hypothetical protein